MSAAALVVGMLIYVSAISCVSVTKCKEKILRKVSSFGSYFYVQNLKRLYSLSIFQYKNRVNFEAIILTGLEERTKM